MATSGDAVCLGIAVDHRLRRLIRPTAPNETRQIGAHQAVLSARGQSCRRSRAEINVTTELAGPSTRGGIAVALQQPRANHPFDDGIDAVIDDCVTLDALDELFITASGGELSIRTSVSVIDLLPFVSEAEMKHLSDQQLRDTFKTASDAFCEKQPEVVLCAGRIPRLPRYRDRDDRKGEAFKLESLGIGKTFGKTPRTPTVVRLRGEGRALIPIYRINGFHLSYALNYCPHHSCLRQLQLLTVVEACTQARTGFWDDETWMQGLRDACARVVESSTSPATSPRSRRVQSPQPEQATRRLYLLDYEKLFSPLVQEMKRIVQSFWTSSLASETDMDSLYDRLLSSHLSSKCNDASLLLAEMSKLEARGWDVRYDQWNKDTLSKVAQETVRFTTKTRGSSAHAIDSAARLKTLLTNALSKIASCKTPEGIDLGKASKAFLRMAVDIESLLLQLLAEENEGLAQLQAEDFGQDLASAIRGMTLGAKPGPVVTATATRQWRV